jgi:hypothetical protein
MPIWNKQSISPPLNEVAVSISLKLTQFSNGNNVQDAAASNIDAFLWRDTCVCSTQLNSPIWKNRAYDNVKKQYSGSIPFKNYLKSHKETLGQSS